ncbi:MAG: glycosyltransferase, partial [Desulfomonilaceae bacterium]
MTHPPMPSPIKTHEHRCAFPSITVITAHVNRVAGVSDALWSVKRQLYPACCLVIDLGPPEENAYLRKKELFDCAAISCESGQNPYDAINKGIAMATGDVVAILDPMDYYAHNRVLWIASKVLADKEVDACYGDVIVLSPDNRFRLQQYGQALAGQKWRHRGASLPPHSAIFIKRRVYEKLGGFRSDLGEGAERELLERFFDRYRVKAVHAPHPFLVKKCDFHGALSDVPQRTQRVFSQLDACAEVKRIGKRRELCAAMNLTGLFSKQTISFASWLDRDWPAPLKASGSAKSQTGVNDSGVSSPRGGVHHASSRKENGLYVVTVNYESDEAVQKLARSLERSDIVKKLIVVDHSPQPRLKIPQASFP